MKLHQKQSKVSRSNTGKEKVFTIQTSAKAFDLLSSGLYSNNVLAVVRELSCNAYDAHVEAGKEDVPFEIHLPNNLEPFFHVKDFGIGLKEDDVMDLYTTYFDSTKSNSNLFIGALGLGSKSPFSYTSSFDIISRFNGVRSTYTAFLNEDGVPTITKLGEVNTDEPNGLTVKVGVQSDDYTRFANETLTALRFFKVKPNVVGYTGTFNFPEYKSDLSGDNWAVYNTSEFDDVGSRSMIAVQGNVGYAARYTQFLDSNKEWPLIQLLDSSILVGYFEIGELEVAASREELKYDDRTVKALRECVHNYINGFADEIEKRVADCTNYWDLCIRLDDLSVEVFNYRGNLLDIFKFINYAKRKNANPLIVKYVEQKGNVQWDSAQYNGWNVQVCTPVNTSGMSKSDLSNTFCPTTEYAIVVNDLNIGGISRTRHYIETTNGCFKAIMFRRVKDAVKMLKTKNKDGTHKVRKMKENEYDKELVDILEEFGTVITPILTSNMAKPPQAATPNKSFPAFTFDGIKVPNYYNRQYGPSRVKWNRVEPEDLDLTEGGVYFPMRHGANIIVAGEKTRAWWSVEDTENNLKMALKIVNDHFDFDNLTMETLYGFGAQVERKAHKEGDWFNIFDLIEEVITEYKDTVLFAGQFAQTECHDDFGICELLTNDNFVKHIEDLDSNSTFKQAILPVIGLFNEHAKNRPLAQFIYAFDQNRGGKHYHTDKVKKLRATPYFVQKDFSCYPMLKYSGNLMYHRNNLNDMFEYIKLIDRS